MPKLHPFTAQLVALVRQMPDEAILALVRDHLGVLESAPSRPRSATKAPRKAGKRRAKRKTNSTKATTRKASRATPTTTTKGPAKGKTKKASRAATKTPTRATASTQRGRRAALVAAVEKLVKASKGVGLAEVAKATGGGKDRVKSVLKELKMAKRIAHAGERKYTRYAANKATALAASKRARAGK